MPNAIDALHHRAGTTDRDSICCNSRLHVLTLPTAWDHSSHVTIARQYSLRNWYTATLQSATFITRNQAVARITDRTAAQQTI